MSEEGRRIVSMGSMGGSRVPLFRGVGVELSEWIGTIQKKQMVHGLNDRETVLLAYDNTTADVSDLIKDHLERNPELTWEQLKVALTERYATKTTSIEAMRTLMKARQGREETLVQMADRVTRLAELAFPMAGAREGDAIQALLADLYVDALSDEEIRRDVIRKAPVNLVEAVARARETEEIYQRIRQGRDSNVGGRRGREVGGARGDRGKVEVPEDWEREADPRRKVWSMEHGSYRSTPGRYGLVCWKCGHQGHRSLECPTRDGRPPDANDPYCQRCGKKGHKTQWCGAPVDRNRGVAPKGRVPMNRNQGNASGLPQKR